MPVMVVCSSRALGERFGCMVLYGVFSTMFVLSEKCKGRVANDRTKRTLIVFIVKRWESQCGKFGRGFPNGRGGRHGGDWMMSFST